MINDSTSNNNNENYHQQQPMQQQEQEQSQLEIKLNHHAIIIVLGDIGRSPRMQYHTVSLLQCNLFHTVSIIGYTGEELIPFLHNYNNTTTENKNTKNNSNNKPVLNVIRFLPPTFRTILEKIPLVYFLWRTISLTILLLYKLITIPSSHVRNCNNNNNNEQCCIVVQNPPAIPLLFVVLLYKKIIVLQQYLKSLLLFYSNTVSAIKINEPIVIVDWHNLGYTMLRNGSLLQKIAKQYEYILSPIVASGHFTVTNAMKKYINTNILSCTTSKHNLENDNNNNVSVLYDCPPDMFQPITVQEQHIILSKLHTTLCDACPNHWEYNADSFINNNQTIFTQYNPITNTYSPRKGRPALVTSSTSWTADEDFSILLDALVLVEERIQIEQCTIQKEERLKIIVIVTGKGPDKQMYIEKIKLLQLQQIVIVTVWLQPNDYPKLIGCGDIGISLHTSTSSVDLPMKVLDLYGCQIPVCAYNYTTLANELVYDTINGRTFTSSIELCNQLYDLLIPLSTLSMSINISDNDNDIDDDKLLLLQNHSFGKLNDYSNALKNRPRWDTNWNTNALPLFQKLLQSTTTTGRTDAHPTDTNNNNPNTTNESNDNDDSKKFK